MKNLFARLSILFSPAAVGIYVTLAFTWSAYLYFIARNKPTENMGEIESFLLTTHQKSIDFRLKQRGERKGSPQVAMLNVDEKAVETVGRWPWPRETTAKAIENAVKLGAKVIAFDIVFSEPSAQPTLEAFNEVSSKISIPTDVKDQFDAAIKARDSDAKMAQILHENTKHLVHGCFGSMAPTSYYDGHSEACYELMFSLSPESKYLNEKESSMVVLEKRPDIPETLKAFYINHLQHISELITENSKPKNNVEVHEQQMRILHNQREFCDLWLDPKDDPTYEGINENWASVLEAEGGDLKARFPTFASWVEWFKSESQRNSVPRILHWTLNTPVLTQFGDSFNTGFFNAHQDADGTVRKSNLILRTGTSPNTYMASIALKAYLVANGYNAQVKLAYNPFTFSNEIESLDVLDENGEKVYSIPVDAFGRLAINYAGRQKIFPHVSMADLLTDSEEMTYEVRDYDPKHKMWGETRKTVKKAEFLKDKVFILGATAIGIYDLRVTPFEENYPGAETHANVLDNLIRRDFLVTHPKEDVYMLAVLLTIGIFLSLSLSFLGALPGLTLTCALSVGIAMIDKYLLFGNGTVVTIILPMGLILVLFLFLISYKYFTEERGKKELRNTFQKYVSPAIVEEILSDPAKIELGGRKTPVTIFFSDLRGFTTISEKLDPRALSDLLNRYLTPMTDLVFQNRGTLDKYMGDAIMAFFGAPISYKEHAKYACRCALSHIKKLGELQAQFKSEGLPDIDVGIGLNTGEVSVGNMGSQTVRSYTVMGDAVNLASRLEGINKQYGTKIIISEFTYEEAKDSFVCREVDWVRVKGKAKPVKIFELIAEGKPTEKHQKLIEHFSQGYGFYHQKRWGDALDSFAQALNVVPDDPVTKLYVERCNDYLTEPPDENWDGVFVMKTK